MSPGVSAVRGRPARKRQIIHLGASFVVRVEDHRAEGQIAVSVLLDDRPIAATTTSYPRTGDAGVPHAMRIALTSTVTRLLAGAFDEASGLRIDATALPPPGIFVAMADDVRPSNSLWPSSSPPPGRAALPPPAESSVRPRPAAGRLYNHAPPSSILRAATTPRGVPVDALPGLLAEDLLASEPARSASPSRRLDSDFEGLRVDPMIGAPGWGAFFDD